MQEISFPEHAALLVQGLPHLRSALYHMPPAEQAHLHGQVIRTPGLERQTPAATACIFNDKDRPRDPMRHRC